MRSSLAIATLCAWTTTFPGCTCNCTKEFRIMTVQVLDEVGLPVADATVTSFFVDTGAPIDCEPFAPHDGRYCIFTDSYTDEVGTGGRAVRITVEKESYATATEEYTFRTDSCKCHVHRVSGPEFVEIVPSG